LDEVIKLVASARTNEGDSVVVHVPTFPRYELECVARGAVVHAVRSDPVGRTDVDELASSFFGITVSSPLT
jgi:histidinol-phosphate/aromatic aminotransferase/cobyric acid decarboxylase-like protein